MGIPQSNSVIGLILGAGASHVEIDRSLLRVTSFWNENESNNIHRGPMILKGWQVHLTRTHTEITFFHNSFDPNPSREIRDLMVRIRLQRMDSYDLLEWRRSTRGILDSFFAIA